MPEHAAVCALQHPQLRVERRVVQLHMRRLHAWDHLARLLGLSADLELVCELHGVDLGAGAVCVCAPLRVRWGQHVELRRACAHSRTARPDGPLHRVQLSLGLEPLGTERRAHLEPGVAVGSAQAEGGGAGGRPPAHAVRVPLDGDVGGGRRWVGQPRQLQAQLQSGRAAHRHHHRLLRVLPQHQHPLGLHQRVWRVAARRRHRVQRHHVRASRHGAGLDADVRKLGRLGRREEAAGGLAWRQVEPESQRRRRGHHHRHRQREEGAAGRVGGVGGGDGGEVGSGREGRRVQLHAEGLTAALLGREEHHRRRGGEPASAGGELELKVGREKFGELLGGPARQRQVE
mmetsp:Transcript_23237/g.75274  ORF Transcript_23237/g.75274 Transcript_23237/m.75274 type:complete len:345 (-) Transcript_23237:1730-2764(-)